MQQLVEAIDTDTGSRETQKLKMGKVKCVPMIPVKGNAVFCTLRLIVDATLSSAAVYWHA
jgi:hypothetical protein